MKPPASAPHTGSVVAPPCFEASRQWIAACFSKAADAGRQQRMPTCLDIHGLKLAECAITRLYLELSPIMKHKQVVQAVHCPRHGGGGGVQDVTDVGGAGYRKGVRASLRQATVSRKAAKRYLLASNKRLPYKR